MDAAEDVDEAVARGWRQRRTGERREVGGEVVGVARAGEDHVAAWLVAAKAVGGVGQGRGFCQQEVGKGGEVGGVELPFGDEGIGEWAQVIGVAKCLSNGEHDLDADVLRAGLREDVGAGSLVEQIEADHQDIPQVVGQGLLEHGVFEVFVEHLAEADEAYFALLLRLLQRGIDVVDEIGVVLGDDAVEVVEVDVVGAQAA